MGDRNKEETFQSVVKMPWALLPSSFFISQVSFQSSFQSFSPCTTVLNYLPVRVLTRLLLATASPECRAIPVERCRQPHWAQQMNNKHYKCRRRSQQVKRLKIRPACQIVATYLHSAQKLQFLVKRAVIVNKWWEEGVYLHTYQVRMFRLGLYSNWTCCIFHFYAEYFVGLPLTDFECCSVVSEIAHIVGHKIQWHGTMHQHSTAIVIITKNTHLLWKKQQNSYKVRNLTSGTHSST